MTTFVYYLIGPRWTKAELFGHRHKTASKRLEAIMKNIVKNKGEFVP